MKKISSYLKRIVALMLVVSMVADLMSAAAGNGYRRRIALADELTTGANDLATAANELNNGYIKVTVSPKNGGFGIRTVLGDKVNKSDNDRYLVYEYDEDNTSFTSFQVTRDGVTKEYIFGGEYPGSSDVAVSKVDGELIATWSVDDLTFTQTIGLVNSGSAEHGAALISYGVKNTGEAAEIKCRILMDTALGYQDYAYYSVGNQYLEFETALGEDGYNKSFYAANNTSNPGIIAYTINASIDNQECKPYQTIFGHWNNLASTVFEYTPDPAMNYTNAHNIQYMTSDSAYALYFDLGQVATGEEAMAATNYGVYSNENVSAEATMTVNVNAPDVLEYAVGPDGKEDQTAYEDGGVFTAKTYIENISDNEYSKIRIMVYAAGGIDPLDQDGNPTNSTYENPYSMEILDITPGEHLEIDWGFLAEPQENGQYAKVHFKIYDVSDEATMGTGAIMIDNLLGEGHSYILCPGSVEKIPVIKFTGSSPETIYSSGTRNLFVTGENFSMLADQSSYKVMLSRMDGNKIDGQDSVEIPSTQIQIDDSTNVMTVIFSEEAPGTLVDGMYQLTIDYTDASKADISGQALRFHVSSEVKYKNDSYGFLAVIKDPDANTYTIHHFADVNEYWEDVENERILRQYVLLEFQGSFIKEKSEEGEPVVYTGTSLSDTDNVMTLNGCLDIRDGTMTITEENGSVTVDFDAEIYTTGSGTFVWDGMCALTELEAGTSYSLIPYSENGDRNPDAEEYPSVEYYSGDPITLLWPSVGQGFQSLMGMLFSLKYGELGVILHENAPSIQGSQTRVVGFGAAIDLSFLIPSSVDKQLILDSGGKTKSILGSSWDAADHNAISFTPDEIRALNKRANYRLDTAKTDATAADVNGANYSDMTVDETPGYNAAYIVIDDVLFGGEYLGVNMALGLGIPPYISGMPALEGLLEIRTVGDWAFSVDGQCHFMSFSLSAGISFRSKNNIPIPDRLNFFLGGITPGINVDGVGVLWLQGAGGGIENLYDTIFMTDSIPPLKLIIAAQFSILQLFSATASLGLSLRGIDVSLTNGQFREVVDETTGVVTRPQPITIDAGIRLDWYPEVYFEGVVNLALAMVITGGGYVVADTDSYEIFLRAGVQIPTDVPLLGGISLTDVNMGVNETKVWGQAEWLQQVIGLTYYWGGDIDWNRGSKVYPTYPELVGMEPEGATGAMVTMVLDQDEETQEPLVMRFGTNVRMLAFSMGQTARNTAATPDKIETDVTDGSRHTMKVYKDGNGKMLVIQWTADDEASAKAGAASVVITEKDNLNNTYPIELLDNSKPANDPANADANANLAYNAETKTAYLTVSLTDRKVYDCTWKIKTPESALLVLYDVEPLPSITVESVVVQGDKVRVTLDGTQLENFTKLTFFVEGKDSGETYLLGGATDPFKDMTQADPYVDLTMPAHAVSDTYTLRVIATDEEATCYSEANGEFSYTNPEQPAAPTEVFAENAGDYKVSVTVGAAGEAFDGYLITAYDENGDPVNGVSGIQLYKDGSAVTYNEDGTIADAPSSDVVSTFIVGGQYQYTDENEETGEEKTLVTGLSAGKYTLEVRRWKKASNGAILPSEPTTATITVKEPVKTEIQVSVSDVAGSNTVLTTMTRSDGTSYELESVNGSDLLIQLTSETESFTGTWRLDGGFLEGSRGQITDATKSADLELKDLKDGTHLLTFIGKNRYGDSVSVDYQFVVDTLAPRLQVAEPVNGGLFEYWTGQMAVSGITDGDAMLTIEDKTTGETVYTTGNKTVSEAGVADESGTFAIMITLDRTILSHDLAIIMRDALGNETVKEVTVFSNGLGSIEKLLIYAEGEDVVRTRSISGGEDVTNTKMPAGGTYDLTLRAKLIRPENAAATDEDLYVLINQAGMVDWVQEVVEGEAEITETADGIILKTNKGSEGIVTARFLINDEGAYSISAAYGEVNGIYKITLPTQMVGYTVSTEQSTLVEEGKSFSFTVKIHDGFVAGSNFKVLANGKEIKAVNGVYTIASVECDIDITVVGVELKLTPSTKPEPEPEPETPPVTGDTNNISGLLCVMAAALIVIVVVIRKRRQEE